MHNVCIDWRVLQNRHLVPYVAVSLAVALIHCTFCAFESYLLVNQMWEYILVLNVVRSDLELTGVLEHYAQRETEALRV